MKVVDKSSTGTFKGSSRATFRTVRLLAGWIKSPRTT